MSLKNPVTPPGIDFGTVQLVAQRLNHYTTPGPKLHTCFENNPVYFSVDTELAFPGIKRLGRDTEIQLYDSYFRKT